MNKFFKDVVYYAAYFGVILVISFIAVFLGVIVLALGCAVFTYFEPSTLVLLITVFGAAVFGWCVAALWEEIRSRKEQRIKGVRVVLRDLDKCKKRREAKRIYFLGKIHK